MFFLFTKQEKVSVCFFSMLSLYKAREREVAAFAMHYGLWD